MIGIRIRRGWGGWGGAGGGREKFRKGSPGPGRNRHDRESSPLNRSHPFPSRRKEKRNYRRHPCGA